MAIEDVDHTKIKAKSPQTNGICERFHRTIQNEFYAIAFRKKIYTTLEQLQHDLDEWIRDSNTSLSWNSDTKGLEIKNAKFESIANGNRIVIDPASSTLAFTGLDGTASGEHLFLGGLGYMMITRLDVDSSTTGRIRAEAIYSPLGLIQAYDKRIVSCGAGGFKFEYNDTDYIHINFDSSKNRSDVIFKNLPTSIDSVTSGQVYVSNGYLRIKP